MSPVPRSNPDTGLDHQDPILVPTWTEFAALKARIVTLEGGTGTPPPDPEPEPDPVTVNLVYSATGYAENAIGLSGANIVDGTTIYVGAIVGPLGQGSVEPTSVGSCKFYLNGVLHTTDTTTPWHMASYAVGVAGDTDTVRVDVISTDGSTVLATASASYLVTVSSPPAATDLLLGTLCSIWDIRPRSAQWDSGAGVSGIRHAFPFTAPLTGTIAQLALHWVLDSPNYYGGDGGHNISAIYGDTAGQPNIAGGIIGSSVDWGDGNIPITWVPKDMGGRGTILEHRSGLGAAVTAGTTYWVVTTNTDGGGWTGLNGVAQCRVAPPADYAPPGVDVSLVYMETGTATGVFTKFIYNENPTGPELDGLGAMYELIYSSGVRYGQGWLHGGDNRFARTISQGGPTIVQTFQVESLPATTSSLWVFVATGSGTLNATMNGVTAQSTAAGYGWMEFPIATTLPVGTNSFTLRSNGSHSVGAFTDTNADGWNSNRTGGFANYNNTGGWAFWSGPDQSGQLGFAIEAGSI